MDWSKLFNYDTLVDIYVPLFAALIGGFITMRGVVRTIKFERKNAIEQTRQSVKPWIFSLDALENYDSQRAGDIRMEGDSPIGSNACLVFVLRNTDNGIGIVEKYVTENNEYLPTIGRILDKNSITHVTVYLNKNENLNDMYFVISDVYGNRYKYKAYQTGKENKGNQIDEIGMIKEKRQQGRVKK